MFKEGDIVKIRKKNLEGKFVCFVEEFVCDNSTVKKRIALVDINGDRHRFELFEIKLASL